MSVVITVFNGRDWLPGCLRALRDQTFPDHEVVVVDNASPDGSAELVASRFPECRLVRLPENRGFAGGTNAGLNASSGEFVALLNVDTVAEPGWLEALVRALDASPAFGYCASRVLSLERPWLLDRAGDLYTHAGVAIMRGHLESADGAYEREEEVFGASAAAAIVRRTVLQDVGLFDEDFFCMHEDVDWCVRARLRGHRCLYVPTAVVRHQGGATLRSVGPMVVYWGQRNLEYVFLKNLPWGVMARSLPHHLLFNLAAMAHAATSGGFMAFLRAKAHVLLALPSILAKRRQIQARRRCTSSEFARLLHPSWFRLKCGQRQRRLARPAADPASPEHT